MKSRKPFTNAEITDMLEDLHDDVFIESIDDNDSFDDPKTSELFRRYVEHFKATEASRSALYDHTYQNDGEDEK